MLGVMCVILSLYLILLYIVSERVMCLLLELEGVRLLADKRLSAKRLAKQFNVHLNQALSLRSFTQLLAVGARVIPVWQLGYRVLSTVEELCFELVLLEVMNLCDVGNGLVCLYDYSGVFPGFRLTFLTLLPELHLLFGLHPLHLADQLGIL